MNSLDALGQMRYHWHHWQLHHQLGCKVQCMTNVAAGNTYCKHGQALIQLMHDMSSRSNFRPPAAGYDAYSASNDPQIGVSMHKWL